MLDIKTQRRWGLTAAVATAFCWSFLAIFLKFGLTYADSYSIVWYRMFVAFLTLTTFLSLRGTRGSFKVFSAKPGLLLVAALSLAFNYVGFMQGVHYTSPVNAQVFIQLGPLMLALAGIFIFKEQLSKTQSMGFVLCIVGFGLFFRDRLDAFSQDNQRFLVGITWIFAAAVTWALFAILQKRLLPVWRSSQINVYIYFVSSLIFLPFVDWKTLAELPWTVHVFFVFLGLNTVLAYGCLSIALKYLPATQVSPSITLNPLLTLVLVNVIAWMKWDFIPADPISFGGYFGAVLAIFGIIVVLSKRRRAVRTGTDT